jgi:hypothetical protein
MKHILYFVVAATAVFVLTYVLVHDKAAAPEAPVPADVPAVVETSAPTLPEDLAAHIASKADMIVLASPAPLASIGSPVTLTGKARGMWFFEASFPVVVVNWDGLIIGEGIATADGEWMTEEFVPFTATVSFTVDPAAYSNRGALILKRDNPSGLKEHDDALEVPVFFK